MGNALLTTCYWISKALYPGLGRPGLYGLTIYKDEQETIVSDGS